MALFGDPAIALLDEPTTGIDPAARRMIWDVINDFRNRGHSILLTSHSLDECEALCSRLAIMTHGQLRCIGEATTLKAVYGQNFNVQVKINHEATDDDREKFINAMNDAFGRGCQLIKTDLVTTFQNIFFNIFSKVVLLNFKFVMFLNSRLFTNFK